MSKTRGCGSNYFVSGKLLFVIYGGLQYTRFMSIRKAGGN